MAAATAMMGCTPKIIKFQVAIATTSQPMTETDITGHQGTTHLCPNTSVELRRIVKGHGSLSATPGPRYKPPECFTLASVPSHGAQLIAAGATGLGSCGDTAIFRLTATHTFWRRYGFCPGPGCPNADREVMVSSSLNVPIGSNEGHCQNEVYELANTKAAVDWDDRYRVSTISIERSPIAAALQSSGLTLSVLHDGKAVTFNTRLLVSNAFQGEKVSGTWTLRLSECISPPPVVTVSAQLYCSK